MKCLVSKVYYGSYLFHVGILVCRICWSRSTSMMSFLLTYTPLVVMPFYCENQFSFTKKSVCTWLTEQPLSQWMMAIIIKREDFSKQEWFACKKKRRKNWFPSLHNYIVQTQGGKVYCSLIWLFLKNHLGRVSEV